jgi:PPM family protein phosphatase
MSQFEDTLEFPSDPTPSGSWPRRGPAGVRVEVGALTHEGRVRDNNEDHYLVAEFERAMRTVATNLSEGRLPHEFAQTAYAVLVADGMGGAAGGEVASREAIRNLVELVLETPDWIMAFDERSLAEVLRRFGQRFRTVRQMLVERAEGDTNLRGMGTTLTVAVCLGLELVIAHVGDSRAYLYRQGRLQQLTHDHTLAQALADLGAIRPEDVAHHPMAHTLTNALGTHEGEIRVELHHMPLEDGDQLLVATDGLSDMVDDDLIARTLHDAPSAADACRALVDRALAAGGRDNVTTVVCRFSACAPGT